MKKLFYVLILLLTVKLCNAQTLDYENLLLRENMPDWMLFNKINLDKDLIVDNSVNPFYLEADLNGDRNLDIALIVKEKSTNKKGILIIHGNSYNKYLLGAGVKFGNGGDDFEWLEVWKLCRDSVVYKTIFSENFDIEGSEPVKIQNIAISVAPSEGSSNIIVWNGTEYEWIHTGD